MVILGGLAPGQNVSTESFDLLSREITQIHSFINAFPQSRAAPMIVSGAINMAKPICCAIPQQAVGVTIANPACAGEVKVLVLGQADFLSLNIPQLSHLPERRRNRAREGARPASVRNPPNARSSARPPPEFICPKISRG